MKKNISMIICLLMLVGTLTGCGNQTVSDSDKLQIVTTIFPAYDWVREVLGDEADNAEITMLLDNGVDLHSYQPTADDIINISTCDLFIYVGGESDGWVEDALANATNKDMKVINLVEALGDGIKMEEVVEGMQESEHDHEHEENADHEHEEEHEHHHNDEHVWLSLKNAQIYCDVIANYLGEIDSDNKSLYSDNATAYNKKLAELDGKYQIVVSEGAKDTVLFADRFPFRYLVDDYNLNYYTAFSGCSAETEASFETIKFLADKVDELNLTCVLTIENVNHKIAETVVENTTNKNQQVLSLDSLQSVTTNDVNDGATYLSIMEKNLEVLTQALQ